MLFFYGLLMLITGLFWVLFFPIIKSLRTNSFVLVTCGITTYMMAHMFDFSLIGNVFVGGLSTLVGPDAGDFIQAVAAMAVMWLIM